MKRTSRWGAAWLAAALLVSAVGCTSVPLRIDAPKQPVARAQGRPVQASACGFQLLLFIPIEVNERASNAYARLQQQAAGGALTDVRMSERWYYAFVGTVYCTEFSATAYPRA